MQGDGRERESNHAAFRARERRSPRQRKSA